MNINDYTKSPNLLTFCVSALSSIIIVVLIIFIGVKFMNYFDIKIESERLVLRPIKIEDKDNIFNNFTDEITVYMYPSPSKDISETIEFIGAAGLHNTKKEIPEFGIWIKKSSFGNGYGREAITLLFNWAKENLDVEYIKYPVDKGNIASKKIPLSLNGKLVKTYQEKTPDGRILDLEEYHIKV